MRVMMENFELKQAAEIAADSALPHLSAALTSSPAGEEHRASREERDAFVEPAFEEKRIAPGA